MSTLRSRLIRMAHENPDLQPLLLPILAEDISPRVAGDLDQLTDQGKNDARAVAMDELTAAGWRFLKVSESVPICKSRMPCGTNSNESTRPSTP